MRKITREDIILNHVETIKQFKILSDLKKELDIEKFDVYLYDKSTIKVIDLKVNVNTLSMIIIKD